MSPDYLPLEKCPLLGHALASQWKLCAGTKDIGACSVGIAHLRVNLRVKKKVDTWELNVRVFEEGALGLDLVRHYQILQHRI